MMFLLAINQSIKQAKVSDSSLNSDYDIFEGHKQFARFKSKRLD